MMEVDGKMHMKNYGKYKLRNMKKGQKAQLNGVYSIYKRLFILIVYLRCFGIETEEK